MLYSDRGLYVLMDAEDRKLSVSKRRDFDNLWTEDVMEFFLWPENPVDSLLKPVLFVPSGRRLEGLLHEMQRKGTFIVIVVNEYGVTLGLVTKEDILEEIVGDIFDKSKIKFLARRSQLYVENSRSESIGEENQ